jgi:long-chain acyl-CoA synthetase
MQTLLELLLEIRHLEDRECIRFYNGFRTWVLSYRQLYRRIAGFVRYLDQEGLGKGDRLLLWGENRPEWVIAFWGCLARGIEVVPIDFRSSARLVGRIQHEVRARLLVYGAQIERGDSGSRLQFDIAALSFDDLTKLPEADELALSPVSPDDVVEIVFTSGTTGEPKGVVHRHRHLCSNLTPLKHEIDKYKKFAYPFQPLRILDLLPLSHLFGQALGVTIPVLLGGAAVFMQELHPGAVMETIRRERVSVLVSVPQHLKNLRQELERRFELAYQTSPLKGLVGAAHSWWRHRSLHAAFGWKFWALVVGGARLRPEEELFWGSLGFVLVQGYGLTEASPVVAVNHPFRPRRGSLGKPMPGQEVKIAPDGEILVRGESVVSEYLGRPEDTVRVSADGWLHTGDLGSTDEEGRLYFRGRKKDVIVTPEGLNIYPQDIEGRLNEMPRVRESVVIGLPHGGEEQTHAVLLLSDPKANAERMIRQVNQKLEAHQRIRAWTVWPQEDFPRTPSTLKVKRREVASQVLAMRSGEPARNELASAEEAGLGGILADMTGRKASELEDRLQLSDDLGLSSLERVDLLSRLEDSYGLELDEAAFAEMATIGELRRWLDEARLIARPAEREEPAPEARALAKPRAFALDKLPRWNRSLPARWIRTALSEAVFRPLLRHYVPPNVEGLEHLEGLDPPLNHNSHLDTAAIMAALPFHWRTRIAPAMGQEFFRAYFQPEGHRWKERWTMGLAYFLTAGLFNAYPLPHQVVGVRRALKFTGELVDHGYCPLVYPEGERSPDGTLQPFQPGIGLMAVRLRVPVVPIHLTGLFEIYSSHDSWPRKGSVRLRVGRALRFREGKDYREATETIRKTIVDLSQD